jgi:prolyl 4-hydroxylase
MTAPHPSLVNAFSLLQSGRVAEALPLIRQRVAADDPLALNLLAEMTWNGMVAQDPVGARSLFERAAVRGHRDAAKRVTNLLASGVSGARDWRAARARLAGEARTDATRRGASALLDAMDLDADGDPAVVPSGETLSERPFVRLFRRALTPAECRYLLDVATPNYRPSTVYDAQRRLVRDPIRTSDCSTIHWLIEDPAIHALNRRLARISAMAVENGEAGEVLRYGAGQEYRPHLDFVRASDNQRVMTALVYLNDEYAGGETEFTKTGLRVRGQVGDVLVFANALPDRSADPLSEHAGRPVTQGTKFIYSRWIHEARWQP